MIASAPQSTTDISQSLSTSLPVFQTEWSRRFPVHKGAAVVIGLSTGALCESAVTADSVPSLRCCGRRRVPDSVGYLATLTLAHHGMTLAVEKVDR